jgi:hypothetical protein
MRSITSNPLSAALVGLLFVLPFVLLNMLVRMQYGPLLSYMRPDSHTSILEIGLLVFVLLLILVGAIVAAGPLFRQGADGKRRLHLLNIVVAFLLLTMFIVLLVGIGKEIYRCDILNIPKCD